MITRRSLAVAAACVGVAYPARSWAQPAPLRIGLTSVILSDQAAFLRRWGQYLSLHLLRPVVFVARDSYQEMLDLLFAQQLHFAWVCGYPYTQHQGRLSLVAAPTYQGQPQYRSYLIRAKVARPHIRGWDDLRGQVLAYADPLSNSGWLVAQVQLAAVGIKTGQLKKTFFAHSHRNVAEAVASRLADAGCIDGYVWDTMVKQGMPVAAATEVIWRSEPYGFPPIVAPMGARSDVTDQLFDALARMPETADGRELLMALNLDGFVRVTDDLYSSIHEMTRAHPSLSGRVL